MVICLDWDADLHVTQLMPLPVCHSLSLASVKSRLVLPFWYWLTRVVPEKGPLNGYVCVCNVASSLLLLCLQTTIAHQHSIAYSLLSADFLLFYYLLCLQWSAFSGLTLLFGCQEEQPACKNWVMRCWCGSLHMVQLMPLLPKTPSSLASFKSRLALPLWYWLTEIVLKKRPLNGCSVSWCGFMHQCECHCCSHHIPLVWIHLILFLS